MTQREVDTDHGPTMQDIQDFLDSHGDEGWFLVELFERNRAAAPQPLVNAQTGLDEQDYEPFYERYARSTVEALHDDGMIGWSVDPSPDEDHGFLPCLELKR